MSAVLPPELRDEFWIPSNRLCTYCGELVPSATTAVFWLADPPILLHRDCARTLGTHLIMDSREAQLASGDHPWPRKAARVLRAALVAAETRV